MTDPYDPPRPRDYALQQELDSCASRSAKGIPHPRNSAALSCSSAGYATTSTRPRPTSARPAAGTRPAKNAPGIAAQTAGREAERDHSASLAVQLARRSDNATNFGAVQVAGKGTLQRYRASPRPNHPSGRRRAPAP